MAKRYNKEEELLRRYLDGGADAQERSYVDQAFNAFTERQVSYKADTDLQTQLRNRIWMNLPPARQQQRKKQRTRLMKHVAIVAAACILIVGIGLLFYPKYFDLDSTISKSAFHDVAPGKTGGTLTLADGQQIAITGNKKGKLLETADVIVSRNALGQLRYEVKANNSPDKEMGHNELQTGSGQQIEIILPDQSVVFLNAGSALRYPTQFPAHGERRVEVQGEGYFEIAKDRSRPFIVEHGLQKIKVLGTHFNVNAYGDKGQVRTTLLEGAISINDKIMRPGQVAINEGGIIRVETANLRKETTWINNDFLFENEKLNDVMKPIARWYGVEVRYADERLQDIPLTAQISRGKSLRTIMKSIAAAAELQYEIRDQVLWISKKKY